MTILKARIKIIKVWMQILEVEGTTGLLVALFALPGPPDVFQGAGLRQVG